jgi:histidinol-phosphate aminotransferase
MGSFVSDKLLKLAAYDPKINPCGIHLDANESFIELPDDLKNEIALKVAAISYNRYPDPLAQGVCAAFGKRYGIDARFITAGSGSDELINIIINAFTQRGDRVLITEPDFSMYKIYCAIAEVEPVILGKQGDLNFIADDMINLANREDVRLIIFSNPCNPTGQGISAKDALKIVDNANCLVVIDEAYMDFWNQSVLADVTKRGNLIVLKTCSKIGFAAARLGFAVANDELTGYLRAAKSPYNVNTLTQAAGEVLLSDKNYLKSAIDQIINKRDSLYSSLVMLEASYSDIIKVYKTHANFVTVQVKHAKDLHQKLMAHGISVRLVADRYFRVTAGLASENEAFIKALDQILYEVTCK